MRCYWILLFFSLSLATWAQPRHLYLTWEQSDTAHTQTIVFQTLDEAEEPRVEVMVGARAKAFPVKSVRFRGHPRRIHWLTLTGLQAKTKYSFRAGDNRYGMSSWRSFRTLPDDDSPLKVVTGGDMYRHPETIQLLAAGKTQDPDVALVGGDIAYANGRLNFMGLWDDWLDNWEQHLNPDDGRIVPMICAIGNHETNGAFGQSKGHAPFYFGFLPQGGEPFFTRDLGSEIDLVVLDTGHVTSHSSQVTFLADALKKSTARFRVALYHVPCYPTHRPYNDRYSQQGRTHWVPLFDRYQLHVALENHEHVFKRTHPLRGGKVVPVGTVYLGDGCWGRTPRAVTGKRWYHAEAASKGHVWTLQNKPSGLLCQALDNKAQVFDETTIKTSRSGPGIRKERD